MLQKKNLSYNQLNYVDNNTTQFASFYNEQPIINIESLDKCQNNLVPPEEKSNIKLVPTTIITLESLERCQNNQVSLEQLEHYQNNLVTNNQYLENYQNNQVDVNIEQFNIGGALKKGINYVDDGINKIKKQVNQVDDLLNKIKNGIMNAINKLKKELGNNFIINMVNLVKTKIKELITPINNIAKSIDIEKAKKEFVSKLVKFTKDTIALLEKIFNFIKDNLEDIVNEIFGMVITLLFYPFMIMLLSNILFLMI